MSRLALIPARGGSKRLPRKNILPFRGRPMIASTIGAALKSELFDRVIVTTDDDEIAAAARSHGAEVLDRPGELGGDTVPLTEVARHALGTLPGFESFCLLMPNCPLREADDIVSAYAKFAHAGVGPVMSVFDYGWSPPQWALTATEGRLAMLPETIRETMGARGGLVCPSGAVRWNHVAEFLADQTWYPATLRGYELPWYRALDIDVAEDYEAALCVAFAVDHGFRFTREDRT